MLKNIPIQYTVKDLIAEIDVEFRGKYDFFYMPQDQYVQLFTIIPRKMAIWAMHSLIS